MPTRFWRRQLAQYHWDQSNPGFVGRLQMYNEGAITQQDTVLRMIADVTATIATAAVPTSPASADLNWWDTYSHHLITGVSFVGDTTPLVDNGGNPDPRINGTGVILPISHTYNATSKFDSAMYATQVTLDTKGMRKSPDPTKDPMGILAIYPGGGTVPYVDYPAWNFDITIWWRILYETP